MSRAIMRLEERHKELQAEVSALPAQTPSSVPVCAEKVSSSSKQCWGYLLCFQLFETICWRWLLCVLKYVRGEDQQHAVLIPLPACRKQTPHLWSTGRWAASLFLPYLLVLLFLFPFLLSSRPLSLPPSLRPFVSASIPSLLVINQTRFVYSSILRFFFFSGGGMGRWMV